MHNAPLTGLDSLAGVIVLIIAAVSVLTLLGMGVMMAVGAMFSKRPLVTSWSEIQQAQFEPFERRSSSTGAQAWVLSLLGAAIVLVAVVGIFFGVEPDKKNIAKDMNMSNLTKKTAPAAKAPAPNPPAAPAAPAADGAAAPAPAAPAAPAAPEAPKP
jgi:hypothetical protein